MSALKSNSMRIASGWERPYPTLSTTPFTTTGHPERSAFPESQENGAFLLSIADTGEGIPPSDLQRIFERFYRVDKARTREIGRNRAGTFHCETCRRKPGRVYHRFKQAGCGIAVFRYDSRYDVAPERGDLGTDSESALRIRSLSQNGLNSLSVTMHLCVRKTSAIPPPN